MSCMSYDPNLPFFITAAFNKGFALHPIFFFASGLGGCLRLSRRLQTDVLGRAEHAQLDVTNSYRAVKEAKGLSALQRSQEINLTIDSELICLMRCFF